MNENKLITSVTVTIITFFTIVICSMTSCEKNRETLNQAREAAFIANGYEQIYENKVLLWKKIKENKLCIQQDSNEF
jgi:hypothetical protein